MQPVICEIRALEFFKHGDTRPRKHTARFSFTQGEWQIAGVEVVVDHVAGPQAIYVAAHENLIAQLEQMLAGAKLAAERARLPPGHRPG